MAKVLLSIDWDYFVPEDPIMDMGHQETLFHILDLWSIRASQYLASGVDLTERIKTTGEENTFWGDIAVKFNTIKTTPVLLAESHSSAFDFTIATGCTEVVSFDAHADLGYRGRIGLKDESLHAGNWLGLLLHEKMIKRATIVYSPTTNEDKGRFADFKEKFQVEFTSKQRLLASPVTWDVGGIFICRSGAWTPPWLDYSFSNFVGELGVSTKKLPPRGFDLGEVSKTAELYKQAMRSLGKIDT